MSEDINRHRRRFLGTVAMTIAAIAIGWAATVLTKFSFVNA
jgi:hypothetical protein